LLTKNLKIDSYFTLQFDDIQMMNVRE